MTIVKDDKKDFIQERISAMRGGWGQFVVGEGDWIQFLIQQRQVEIYSQGVGWRSVAGKLQKENMRGKGGSG